MKYIGTPIESFNFVHLGIQEYFAAKHVATFTDDDVYKLLKESFLVTSSNYWFETSNKSVHLFNMWTMHIKHGEFKSLRRYLGIKFPIQILHKILTSN